MPVACYQTSHLRNADLLVMLTSYNSLYKSYNKFRLIANTFAIVPIKNLTIICVLLMYCMQLL